MDFDEYIGNLDGLDRRRGSPSGCSSVRSHEYVIEANWKTITENYHECYHCPSIHPELCVVTPPDSGENFPHDGAWVGGLHGAEGLRRDDVAHGRVRRRPDPRPERQAGARGLLLRPVPEPADQPAPRLRHDPPVRAPRSERSRVECAWLFPPEARERPGFSPDYAIEFWDITNRRGLAGVRVGAARAWRAVASGRGRSAGTRTRSTRSRRMVAQGYVDGRASRPPQVHEDGRPDRRVPLEDAPSA